MSATVIADLIERVAAATGADRELDGAIMAALEPPFVRGYEAPFDYFVRINDDDQGLFKPHRGTTPAAVGAPVREYTSSIDAALALVERVLAGWDCSISPDEGAYSVEMTWPDGALTPEQAYFAPVGRGPTRPLAILLALLTALQSQTPGPTGASNEGGGHVG